MGRKTNRNLVAIIVAGQEFKYSSYLLLGSLIFSLIFE